MSVIDNALQALIGLSIEIKKRWENASPTSNFAAQNINIGTNDYDFLIIPKQSATRGSAQTITTDIVVKDDSTYSNLSVAGYVSSANTAQRGGGATRGVTAGNATIQFQDGLRLIIQNGQCSTITDNTLCKPLAIYTVKLLGRGYGVRLKRYFKKAWENASPTSTFAAQNIPVSALGDGDIVAVETINLASGTAKDWFVASRSGNNPAIILNFATNNGNNALNRPYLPWRIRRYCGKMPVLQAMHPTKALVYRMASQFRKSYTA